MCRSHEQADIGAATSPLTSPEDALKSRKETTRVCPGASYTRTPCARAHTHAFLIRWRLCSPVDHVLGAMMEDRPALTTGPPRQWRVIFIFDASFGIDGHSAGGAGRGSNFQSDFSAGRSVWPSHLEVSLVFEQQGD